MLERFLNLNKEKFDNDLLKKVVTATKENEENYINVNTEIEQIKSYFNDLKLNDYNLKNENILDVGSGTIRFDKYIKEKYESEVYSIDTDKKSLGKEHIHELICEVGEQKIELPNDMFGLVISHGALPEVLVKIDKEKNNINETESERKLNLFFDESYRILRDFGEIRISVGSLNYINNLIKNETNTKHKAEHLIYKTQNEFIRSYLKNKYNEKFKEFKINKDTDLFIIKKIPKEIEVKYINNK